MSDVFDFRLARAPQRLIPKRTLEVVPVALLEPTPAASSSKTMGKSKGKVKGKKTKATFDYVSGSLESRAAASYVKGATFLGGGKPLGIPLRELDEFLTARDNRATPAEISKFLEVQLDELVGSKAWSDLRKALANSLIASLLTDVDPAIRGELARLILVAGLVEELAQIDTKVKTAEDVFDQLRWSTLVLPPQLLQAIPRPARLARRYGFSDYFVVRDEWSKYQAGEIAHIENAMAGELRKREHSKLTELESSDLSDEYSSRSEEHDTQTTDRFSVNESASTDVSIAAHIEGKVDVSASYASVKLDTHLGGSFDYSRQDAKERASAQAQETISRAVVKVEEQTRNIRSTRRLERFEEHNTHEIDNTADDAKNVSAVYRWVDKIQRLQVFGFPHRFLLEFEVPEPAAFVRWRRSGDGGDFANPAPPPLVVLDGTGKAQITDGETEPLAATDINELNYLTYAARYGVADVDPPPEANVLANSSFELKIPAAAAGAGGNEGAAEGVAQSFTEKTKVDLVAPGGTSGDGGIAVPEGYRLGGWSVKLSTYPTRLPLSDNPERVALALPEFDVTVGLDTVYAQSSPPVDINTAGMLYEPTANFNPPANVARTPLTGSVPVTVSALNTREFRAHVEFRCQRLPEHLVAWQLRTFESISLAYQTLKLRHEEEKAAREISGGVRIEGDSPARNAEVITEELKRQVIQLVSNGNYPPADSRTSYDDPDVGPQFDPDFAAQTAPAIQFIEQAFEWENMTYVTYPYFWTSKKNWDELSDIQTADPVFDRFLRSGSARVVLPARPGYESQVQMYVDLGVLWGGGPIPAIGTPEYLSIAEEIKARQQKPRTGEPGEWWDVKLPTTLVSLDDDGKLPKVNPAPTLGPPE